jgi:diguanylate cyclase (GGDEF)-like protein/PAS domain S-box-containing protein
MTNRAAWRAPIVLIALVTVAAGSADRLPATPALIVRAVVGMICVVAIGFGAHRNQARPAIAWWVMAIGIGVWVIGDAIWDSLDVTLSNPDSDWYILPNVLYLIMYPALVWAIVKLVAEHGHSGGVERAVDSFIPAVLLLLVVRAYLVRGQDATGTLDSLFNAAFAIGDALLLAGVSWLLLTPGKRNAAAWLLASGTATLLATDVMWDIQARVGSDSWNWLLNPMYSISYAVIGAAALHPSVATLGAQRKDARPTTHTSRLLLLCVALVMIPVLAFASDRNDPLIEIMSSTLVAAIGVRFFALVRALQSAERDAALSARRFSSLVESVPVGILEADRDARIIFSNHAIDEMLGRSVVGMTDHELIHAFVDPRDQEAIRRTVTSVVEGHTARAQLRMRDADGVERWVAWYAAPVQDGSGGFAGAFSSMMEITSLKDAETTLALQATHDPLTGLPNRRLLFDRLSTALTRLNRSPGMVVVLFLDLDGFKTVNDSCGHDAGDELLQVVSERLRATVRGEDAVTRFGGDEFVAVLEQVRDRAGAAFVADKVIRAIRAPVSLHRAQRTVQVGASIGIAVSTSPTDDPDALVRDADTAMFDAKRAGRGIYRFFDHRRHAAEDWVERGEVRGHI